MGEWERFRGHGQPWDFVVALTAGVICSEEQAGESQNMTGLEVGVRKERYFLTKSRYKPVACMGVHPGSA